MTPDNEINNTIQPVDPLPTKVSYRNHLLILLLLFIFLLTSLGLGWATFLKMEQIKPISCEECGNQQTQKPDSSSVLHDSTPVGWLRAYDSKCRVSLAYPPQNEEYIQYVPELGNGLRRYWRVRAFDSEGAKKDRSFNIAFVDDAEASGYIEGTVFVTCMENDKGYTLESYMKSNELEIEEFNKDFEITNLKVEVKDSIRTQKWGREIVLQSYTQKGMGEPSDEYFVVTPTMIYNITTISMSTDSKVIDATSKILDSVIFAD